MAQKAAGFALDKSLDAFFGEEAGQQVDARTLRVGQERCRRLFDQLLVAPLQRAVALAQRHDAALAIAEDLHFDMPGVRNEALEIDARIAEAGIGGALHPLPCRFERSPVGAERHADAAATAIERRPGPRTRRLDPGRSELTGCACRTSRPSP